MSTKFEQLLDLIVNEEMDKANELFHEIVVEKSREIYENLIAEEAEESVEEGEDDDDESAMEEAADDDNDDLDEGEMDLESSYSMEADDDESEMDHDDPEVGDATDDLEHDVEMDGEDEGGEEQAMMDIKDAIAELEAAFAELEQAHGGDADMGDDMGDADMGDDMGDADMGDEDEGMMMGHPAMEGRRITREYTEKVGNDWEKNSQKSQGQYLGAGTGDKDGAPQEGKSPISSGSGKPTSGANAKNLAQGGAEGQSNTGTKPNAVNKGITPEKGDKLAKGMHNVDGVKSGVKTLSKVAGGHGAEKKGAGPGPVGAGTGDKAGQTSIDPATSKQFLPQYGKK